MIEQIMRPGIKYMLLKIVKNTKRKPYNMERKKNVQHLGCRHKSIQNFVQLGINSIGKFS